MENTQLSLSSQIQALLTKRPVLLQVLRFAAIGALNTSLDFIILNYVSKVYGISSGLPLGLLNAVSFSVAVLQSYLWNKAWTFEQDSKSPLQNAIRLVLVGGLGAIAFLAVFFGATKEALPLFFLLILLFFLTFEVVLWVVFGLGFKPNDKNTGAQFLSFVVVSVIGLLINSAIIAVASSALAPSLSRTINPDAIKNVAKALATIVSLAWNFVGYKLFVFKK